MVHTPQPPTFPKRIGNDDSKEDSNKFGIISSWNLQKRLCQTLKSTVLGPITFLTAFPSSKKSLFTRKEPQTVVILLLPYLPVTSHLADKKTQNWNPKSYSLERSQLYSVMFLYLFISQKNCFSHLKCFQKDIFHYFRKSPPNLSLGCLCLTLCCFGETFDGTKLE